MISNIQLKLFRSKKLFQGFVESDELGQDCRTTELPINPNSSGCEGMGAAFVNEF